VNEGEGEKASRVERKATKISSSAQEERSGDGRINNQTTAGPTARKTGRGMMKGELQGNKLYTSRINKRKKQAEGCGVGREAH